MKKNIASGRKKGNKNYKQVLSLIQENKTNISTNVL